MKIDFEAWFFVIMAGCAFIMATIAIIVYVLRP